MTQSDSVPCDAVGRRIIYRDEYGTVRFVGTVSSAAGIWLGVEWDNPERGKHNGTHEGVQYFQCSHPTGGSFIRPQKANFGVDFLSAVRDRYGQEGNQGIQDCRGNPLRWGKKPIEFLGSQDVKQRWFDALLIVSVGGCQVSHANEEDEISNVCPNIVELDLAKNLLPSWDKVAQITRQLRKLEHLDLSQNKLAIISNPVSLSDAFANLKALAIQHNGLTWAQVLECSQMWPVLERAHLSSNAISVLERPIGVLQSLTLLDLSSNLLADENQLVHIAYLPRLEQLILSNTGLTSLHFDDIQPDGKTAMFPKLKFLAIDKNRISEISADERKGAELDYRKRFGKDWLKAGGHQDPEKNRPDKEFCAEHPRYQELIEKYGAAELSEMEQQKLFALKDQLIALTIRCPDNPDQKQLEKKLPDSMIIQKVRGLLHRLLKIPGAELKLTYISSKMDMEIDMDNDLKPLSYYSIESGDCILVRW
ncbi:tubulin-specific chaperone E isoform X2 [Carcharodon carcharias]|uniref:tubulin-specific chaperone E isoform X2 n=1 Tax=Carcharodon carcharias TaxID=13397 RepID=UPI001B7E8927|nr:tubulin-specific chaperone E isoform X2 [Carcharodon carcharias]